MNLGNFLLLIILMLYFCVKQNFELMNLKLFAGDVDWTNDLLWTLLDVEGDLFLLWKEEVNVNIQSFSTNHVDVLIRITGMEQFRVTRFYGFPDLNQRYLSWEMLRNIGRHNRDDWIIGGDFNEVTEENEKSGGRRKSQMAMDELKGVINELALVNIKTDQGWFTWTNKRRGCSLVKEHLNCFLVSENWLRKVPFLSMIVLHQESSDHEVILLDIVGRRSKDWRIDARLAFHYEDC